MNNKNNNNNNLIYLVIIILIVIIFYEFHKTQEKTRETFQISEPCSDYLSDQEYLLHMIPHHQVAVDISLLHKKKSDWPEMQEVLRKLIYNQKYEIILMNDILPDLFTNISENESRLFKENYIKSVGDFVDPNKLELTDVYCDPHFFDPEGHKKHLESMVLNDRTYIEHMIPHHQVAVDMSKKLLKHTKNDFMINLAYRIIRSQQAEVILLQDMLDSKFKNKSNLII